MPYKVDVWGGELHTRHVEARAFADWRAAAAFMHEMVETGALCNVLHSDFIAPPERVAEMERAMAAQLLGRP